MKTATRDILYTNFCTDNKAQIKVEAGEIFAVETELCSGGWLTSPDVVWRQELEQHGNFLNCIDVVDARTGDMLAVHILDIKLDDLGYTGLEHADINPYARTFFSGFCESNVKILKIENGFIHWPNGIKIPIRPMIGCFGTATLGRCDGSFIGAHGGNMDASEITTGATIYLPVNVKGARLYLGDVHAIQGDGEVTGWGVECRARVKLSIDIVKPFNTLGCVFLENHYYYMSIFAGSNFREAFEKSAAGLVEFVNQRTGYAKDEVFILMGILLKSHLTQCCFPDNPIQICKLTKNICD